MPSVQQVLIHLMGNLAIVLEDVVVLDALRDCYLLRDGEYISEMLIRKFMELLCMVW